MEIELERRGSGLGYWIPKEALQALELGEKSQIFLELKDGPLILRHDKRVRLQKLLEELEASGPDPHGELVW